MNEAMVFPNPPEPHPVEVESDLTKRARRFGHIVSVTGSRAIVALERNSYRPSSNRSDRVSIGTLVAVQTPNAHVVGIVSETSSPMPDISANNETIRLVEIFLAGEIPRSKSDGDNMFRRGVQSFPSIGDRVRECNSDELASIYGKPNVPTIEIGTLFQDKTVPVQLLLDDLLGKHFLVVGNTGTGKSCAIMQIVKEALKGNDYAHVVLLDLHNEYSEAFGDKSNLLNHSNLRLPFWLLTFPEICTVLVGEGETNSAEVEILSEAIVFAKRNQLQAATGRILRIGDGTTITVDTPSPYRMSEVLSYLNEQMGKLEQANRTLPYRKLKTRIEALINDSSFSFMFGGVTVEDNMADVLGDLFRIPANGKPVTVIDLSSVPWNILDVVISLVARLAFDLGVWCKGKVPTLLICEEVHRYAPASAEKGFMPTRAALSRIAKEGRKYGISLGLVTQRPCELDPTIISQCSTLISMRLSTDRDQEIVRANTQDGGLEFLDFLPILGERQAIVLGQGAPMPMRIQFHELTSPGLKATDKNKFSVAWKDSSFDREAMEEVVSRWRVKGRDLPQAIEKPASRSTDDDSSIISTVEPALPPIEAD